MACALEVLDASSALSVTRDGHPVMAVILSG
jgi:hypothetical protein